MLQIKELTCIVRRGPCNFITADTVALGQRGYHQGKRGGDIRKLLFPLSVVIPGAVMLASNCAYNEPGYMCVYVYVYVCTFFVCESSKAEPEYIRTRHRRWVNYDNF